MARPVSKRSEAFLAATPEQLEAMLDILDQAPQHWDWPVLIDWVQGGTRPVHRADRMISIMQEALDRHLRWEY